MKKQEIKIGIRFGRWEVIEDAGLVNDRGVNKSAVIVKCDCGTIKQQIYSVLKRGLTTSCGCFRKENAAILISKRDHKHNLSKHPLFGIWSAMKARCYNENEKQYKDYGGRGVRVSNKWVHDFMNFYEWAINNGYVQGLQIDREDNDGDYEPSNCRFVTPAKNMRNRRNNNIIEYKGVSKCITDWAKELGMSPTGLQRRLRSWDKEKAFTLKNMRLL